MRAILFSGNRRGNALLLFVLMLPTLIIPLVGLGVDATMLYIVNAKLSAAVDGAALGAGRLLGTQANPQEIAGEFLRANFKEQGLGFWGATNLQPTITVTLGTTKTVRVAATADVPLLFSRVFGQRKGTVNATAVATRRDSRIVLVIDRSGSMNTSDGAGSTVIADVKAYARGFVGKFTPGTDELGLVVYDGSAVVGYPTVQPWDPTVTATSTGGPNKLFSDGTSNDMLHMISLISADSGTNIAEGLQLAYIELQKAHMKEMQEKGMDERLSSIVLFTDGVPSAVSLYLNNPNNGNADNVINTAKTCTYETIATNQQDAARMMLSWLAIPYNSGTNPPYSTSGASLYEMFLLASRDTTAGHTVPWWMSNGSTSTAKDAAIPVPSTPYNGCTSVYSNSGTTVNTNLPSYLTKIPAADRYGNSLTGTGYSNSRIIKSNGSTLSVYNGTNLDRTKVSRDYHWGLAIWNAADAAAANIRNDSNFPNRPGDTQRMQIGIYGIGYMGNGGIDDGLLKRIANDKRSTSYDPDKATGLYVPASDASALSAAFDTIASVILRLAQ
jgi:Flp pilus assembly protein TadG